MKRERRQVVNLVVVVVLWLILGLVLGPYITPAISRYYRHNIRSPKLYYDYELKTLDVSTLKPGEEIHGIQTTW